jgi:hypothetical protein
VDRLPANRRLSDSVQQDQWLTRSGSISTMGEVVEDGRRQAGRDEVSSWWGRLQSIGTRPTPTANRSIPRMCLWVAGHSSVETIRDQLRRAIAAGRIQPESLGRVSVATLHNVGEVLRLSVGPGPRPTRAEVATQPVRSVPRSTACSSALPNPGQALPACRRACSVAPRTPTVTSSGSFNPGDTERQQHGH